MANGNDDTTQDQPQPQPQPDTPLSVPGSSVDVMANPAVQPVPTVASDLSQMLEPQPQPNLGDMALARHQGVMGRILHTVASIMAPTESYHVSRDDQGNISVDKSPATTGDMWKRIAAAAIGGAATGLAQQGVNAPARSVAAGFQIGQQAAQAPRQQAEQEAETQQNMMLRNAQMARIHQQIAESQFNQKMAPIKEARLEAQQALDYRNSVEDDGGTDYGTYGNEQEMRDMAKAHPELVGYHMGQGGQLLKVPEMDGRTRVYGLPSDAGGRRLTEARAYPKMVNVDAKGNVTLGDAETAPKGMKTDEYWRNVQSRVAQNLQAENVASQIRQREATPGGRPQPPLLLGGAPGQPATAVFFQGQTPTYVPLKPGLNRKLGTAEETPPTEVGDIIGTQWGGGDPRSTFETVSQKLANGDMVPSEITIPRGKGQPSRNDYIARADQIARGAGQAQGYDPAQAEQENTFAKRPQTQAAVNGIDRIIGPNGQFDQLLNLASKAGLTPFAPINDITLRANKWLGDEGTKNFLTGLEETRRSIAGLMGNPLLGGSETDKKLEQAQAMLGENPTLKNIQSAHDVLTQALETQRSAMVDNNRFLRRRFGGTSPRQQLSLFPGAAPAPAPAAGGTVSVQIPGMPAGTIPRDQIDAFKKVHPNATIGP